MCGLAKAIAKPFQSLGKSIADIPGSVAGFIEHPLSTLGHGVSNLYTAPGRAVGSDALIDIGGKGAAATGGLFVPAAGRSFGSWTGNEETGSMVGRGSAAMAALIAAAYGGSMFAGGGASGGGTAAPASGALMSPGGAQQLATTVYGTGGTAGGTGAGASGGFSLFSPSTWSMPSFMSGGGAGGGGGIGPVGTGLMLTSGLLGMRQSSQLDQLGEELAAQQDPFGPYRSQYAEQLARLSADPNSVTSLPGFEFARDQGQQALMRASAARGKLGSGEEAIALQKYGQDFAGTYLQQEQQRLAQLAGAQFAPSGGQLNLQANIAGMNTQSNSLNTLGMLAAMRGW